jgi:hypothetical protein
VGSNRLEYDDMSPTQRVRRNRAYLTLIVAASQFLLMALGVANRLSFSVPTRYPLLQQTLNSPVWTIFHGLCFVAIVVALKRGKGIVTALGAATGVLSAWAFLSLLWGLSTPTPVSLAGPILGGAIATLSYLLTISWARAPRVHKPGE